MGVGNQIAVENSTWNNIGDAFYQLSLLALLRRIFPKKNIVSFDGPIERAFRPGRYRTNALDSRFLCNSQHYVFSGPILGNAFFSQYAGFIEEIQRRGKTYSLLSMHCSVGGDTLQEIKQFLNAHPPVAIHTRDSDTFKKLSGLSCALYDGVCFAFFVNRMEHLPDMGAGGPYVCSSYYSMPEPEFAGVSRDQREILDSGVQLRYRNPKAWKIARHLEQFWPSPSQVGSWKVVRPVHGFYRFAHNVFSKSNSYLTYNPEVFLAVYKYCDAVFTDRVHAGVVGLSFGKPVMVNELDGRFSLFARWPIEKKNGFMVLDQKYIDIEYEKIFDWLKENMV